MDWVHLGWFLYPAIIVGLFLLIAFLTKGNLYYTIAITLVVIFGWVILYFMMSWFLTKGWLPEYVANFLRGC